jgi:hypothetical protein
MFDEWRSRHVAYVRNLLFPTWFHSPLPFSQCSAYKLPSNILGDVKSFISQATPDLSLSVACAAVQLPPTLISCDAFQWSPVIMHMVAADGIII